LTDGLQEGAAEKFDKLFEEDVSENSDANVGKMLANAPQHDTERCGTRTHDTLIKSQGVEVAVRQSPQIQRIDHLTIDQGVTLQQPIALLSWC